jgi:hypothetical protein
MLTKNIRIRQIAHFSLQPFAIRRAKRENAWSLANVNAKVDGAEIHAPSNAHLAHGDPTVQKNAIVNRRGIATLSPASANALQVNIFYFKYFKFMNKN